MRGARRLSLISLILVLLMVPWVVDANDLSRLPPAIARFCMMAFAGRIADKGQPYNPGATLEKDVPSRRILDYLVGKRVAYLWYEHGGERYHQHLVVFSNTPPYELKKSYVFDATTHTDIHKLIRDTHFLNNHLSNQCGL